LKTLGLEPYFLSDHLRCVPGRYGQDHLLMEINFPKDYPHDPFFIRVVSPRYLTVHLASC
jgi:hypothetical protein